MSQLNTFTSTGTKLIYHPERIIDIKRLKFRPISLQFAPTSTCNLPCIFCSNRNRSKNESLPLAQAKDILLNFKSLGAKTVENTGGGEPTLYPEINELIAYQKHLGYSIGLITNGTGFKRLNRASLEALTWIRISTNVLEYRDDIFIPEDLPDNITLGFSYVINENTKDGYIFDKIKNYAEKYNAQYVRIVPDCQVDSDTQDINNKILPSFVSKFGSKFFYQPKVFSRREACYWAYIKPFVLHDGWVYPCSSVVLNSDSGEKFNEKFRWVHSDDISAAYSSKEPIVVQCDHCVFDAQNKMVEKIIAPKSKMDNFV